MVFGFCLKMKLLLVLLCWGSTSHLPSHKHNLGHLFTGNLPDPTAVLMHLMLGAAQLSLGSSLLTWAPGGLPMAIANLGQMKS